MSCSMRGFRLNWIVCLICCRQPLCRVALANLASALGSDLVPAGAGLRDLLDVLLCTGSNRWAGIGVEDFRFNP